MSSSFTATVVEWNADRGFGFVEANGRRTFLHIRDIEGGLRRPSIGDRVCFESGVDRQGRPCAKKAEFVGKCGGLGILPLLIVAVLLVLPSLAALSLPFDGHWIVAYAIAVSGAAYLAYSEDKKRARRKAWRIPEAELHFLEMIGGWPGAFLAQRRLRHKCSKGRFQLRFWLIVLLFQLISLDCLANWKHASKVWQVVGTFTESAQNP